MVEDSQWSVAYVTIYDAPGEPRNSQWSPVKFTMAEPLVTIDSQWSVANLRLRPPHHPIAVKTALGIKYTPLQD